jgi:mannosyltransferase
VLWRARPRIGSLELAVLAALVAASGLVRWKGVRVWLWIDEGLSVGVASKPLGRLHEVLRGDGAPPLYYVLLKGWMAVFGRSEVALHALSLVFGLAMIPAALWAGWSLFGRRAGWICAVLTATNPLLSAFSFEARSYSLMALLALLMVATFLHAFAFGRRRMLPGFVATTTLLLYTHNWGLYMVAGAALALAPIALLRSDRRRLVIDVALAFGAVALLFLPWLPTLLDQTRHTGAPWSPVPGFSDLVDATRTVMGKVSAAEVIALVAAFGFIRSPRLGRRPTAAIVAGLLLAVTPLLLGWLVSQFEPNWATRYFVAVTGAALLVAAAGLARAGWAGVATAAIIATAWLGPISAFQPDPRPRLDIRANVKEIAARLRPQLRAGDLVISTHPEQVPVVHYYLPGRFRFATPMGPVPDADVFDWRDVVERLRRSTPKHDLVPLIDDLTVGRRVALLQPVETFATHNPEYVELFEARSQQWARVLRRDPRLHVVGGATSENRAKRVRDPSLSAVVFEKVSA